MIKTLKKHFSTGTGIYTLIFAVIFLVTWYKNATEGTKYDLIQLRDTYTFIVAQMQIKHIVDSGLNSPVGKPIGKEEDTK